MNAETSSTVRPDELILSLDARRPQLLREPLPAVQLAAFAARYWERRFGQLTRSDRRDLLRVRRLALRQLDAAALDAAWAQGEQLELPAAVALALGTAAAPAPRESA